MKMKKTDKTFEDYINEIDPKHVEVIQKLDQLIVDRFSTQNRFIWEGIFWGGSDQTIVGYGEIPLKDSDDTWFMVGLSIQKNYYSIYVCTIVDNEYLVKKYADELGKVKTGSSKISFNNLDKLNLDTFNKLLDISYNQWSTKNTV